ncbi:hypothetical protein DWX62_12100 [Bacteroides sp. AF20-13LB]|nr:hypothetical protein DWX62_12100 [Bacteroides sp. AF20-13LB]
MRQTVCKSCLTVFRMTRGARN